MKTKTYTANSAVDIDKLANDFNEEHNVKFSQTDTVVVGSVITHKVVLFYDE